MATDTGEEIDEVLNVVAGFYSSAYIDKIPCRTSILSGAAWMQEILKTAGFDSTRRMSIEERVGICLFIVGLSTSNREAQERFQHSGETISRSEI
jgi:hypothetical protein